MNYVMVVSYNGAKYFGFEKQKNHPSIQGEIEKALSTYLGYPMTIHGSGRTDKGVHAIGQRCNFKPKKEIKDLNAAVFSLNRLLPKDIFIKSMEKKDDDFDSRHSTAKKVYSYSFHHGPRDPFAVTEYQLEYKKFDFDLFEKAMRIFLGKHDFKNFTPKPIDKDNFIRDILEMTFDLHEGHMRVTLTANGFMTYMVRTMVGVAMRVGEGKMTLGEVKKALDAKERKIISFKADPSGLCLEDVIY